VVLAAESVLKGGVATRRGHRSSPPCQGIWSKSCTQLHHMCCQFLTSFCGLKTQPAPTLSCDVNFLGESAPVRATQGSAAALPSPHGGRKSSGTLRSDILRDATAIARDLPMTARRAHDSEGGWRIPGTSQDGDLRRDVALMTRQARRQQAPRRVSRARAGGKRAASPAEGIAPNFARRDALAEAPRVADRSTAVWGGTDTSRSAPDGKGERAARRRG
jgi:hypothetical protein